MEMIAAETMPPVSVEMRKTSAEANLGMGWPRALENLGRRMPLLEVNLFISAVQLHCAHRRQAERGDGRSWRRTCAKRSSLQGEVRALAAHGKLTGVILTILPIVIAGMMMFVSPGYMQMLYQPSLGQESDRGGGGVPGAGALRDSQDRGHQEYERPELLIAFFLFTAGRRRRGRIRVCAAARAGGGGGMIPAQIALGSRDMPIAQAAVLDMFRLIGEAMPEQAASEPQPRRELVPPGYRWPSAVSVFLGIKCGMALMLGTAAAWAGVTLRVRAISSRSCRR